MTASETRKTKRQDNLSSDTDSKTEKSWSFWTVFSSTFLTIFLAEMGDKTQLATLLMSAESQSPWVVFAGAAMALIATSLLGVLIGYWLARRLSPKTLDIAVALLLLVITGLLVGDVLNS
ncbi:hypothetical protein cce_2793 [Crocosphaera subtropica ATCC 51142]|uniref:GDT1 family protein n=1 Tax=Crocosphaera subtropica (strain ATCC 51142 / BH68) TaxID=43989 RepID=B1WU79_CROS5|nr:TMEM165/GDT1 family protein [Crocosphaera subtropica]ACB52141.1 hypothetical protein cce_2793 [Crocosphaera subtropica ATCC 51142]